MRKALGDIGRKLLARSAVNEGVLRVETPCREWRGASHNQGYGRLWDGERLQYTHRLAYEVWVGPIPEGLDVLHRCDNTCCIEPGHLWCGTHAENMRDKEAKGRGGHEKKRGRRYGPSPQRGSKHAKAKLTEDEVRTIAARLKRSYDRRNSRVAIAREFGVSDSLIRGIARGQNWGWLTGIKPKVLEKGLLQ